MFHSRFLWEQHSTQAQRRTAWIVIWTCNLWGQARPNGHLTEQPELFEDALDQFESWRDKFLNRGWFVRVWQDVHGIRLDCQRSSIQCSWTSHVALKLLRLFGGSIITIAADPEKKHWLQSLWNSISPYLPGCAQTATVRWMSVGKVVSIKTAPFRTKKLHGSLNLASVAWIVEWQSMFECLDQ